ncbi:MAG: DNA repair protein RecO [Proteobacteria bacterium]|nr:DNA repair protein RecO [Pseudomonadota bacterium]
MPRYNETTGYIVHTRKFKDSSLIIEFFSKDFGLIQLIAKGIKKNKNLKPQLQNFSLLKIQYFGKSQLKTLTSLNVLSSYKFANLISNTTGLYLNELLHYSLVEYETAEDLFNTYQSSLASIGKIKLGLILRQFEREILKYNGFELQVPSCLQNNQWLSFSENQGITIATTNLQKLCLVEDLKSFIAGKRLNLAAQKRLNKFMYLAISICFTGKKLYSRNLLESVTKPYKTAPNSTIS